MRRMHLWVALLALVPLSLLPLGAEAGPGKEPNVLAYADNGYAVLDPSRFSTVQPNHERLLLVLLEPLTTLDPATGEVKPGTAASWSVGADGRTWTFKIRPDAKWDQVRQGENATPGGPVTAHDFVDSWKRTLDPYKTSPWASQFDGIQGCREITLNSQKVTLFSVMRKALENLVKQNPAGIPGDQLNETLDEIGVRPFLSGLGGRSMKRLSKWKDEDKFTPEAAAKVIKDLKKARRKIKREADDAIDAFGKPESGVYASDDATLVVKTRGVMPFLPELLARGCFAPLHRASYKKHRDKAFDDWRLFVANGPYRLKGRGAKPPPNQQGARVLSVVHLEKNPAYTGPNVAKMPEIMCYTDQGMQEDLFRFKDKDLQHVFFTWPEYPGTGDPKRPDTNLRKKFEGTSGYQTRPTATTVFLRFRCDRGLFESKATRQAIAMTIDRKGVAEQFWPPAVAIDRIVPPGVKGRLGGVKAPDVGGNEAKTKTALAKAGIDEDSWIEVHSGESSGEGRGGAPDQVRLEEDVRLRVGRPHGRGRRPGPDAAQRQFPDDDLDVPGRRERPLRLPGTVPLQQPGRRARLEGQGVRHPARGGHGSGQGAGEQGRLLQDRRRHLAGRRADGGVEPQRQGALPPAGPGQGRAASDGRVRDRAAVRLERG